MPTLKYWDGENWIPVSEGGSSGVDLTTVGVDMTDCDLTPDGANGAFTGDGTGADGTKQYKLDLNLPRPPVVTTSDGVEPTDACDGDFWVDESEGSSGGGDHIKAFVNFNGKDANPNYTLENGGIRKSFNVSSVTDLGPGHYEINFETSFPDNKYVWSGNAGDVNLPGAYGTPIGVRTGVVTPDKMGMMTPMCYISTSNINSSNSRVQDYENVCVTIVGDYP